MRNKSIDFLRGVAVILVLFRHHWVGIDAIQHVGWVGVDLFFVLSGFLVSGLLFAERAKFGDVHRGRFLIRRAFKIYPLFYLSLLITFALGLGPHLGLRNDLMVWVSEVFFLQNYFYAIWGHHWSLAVEEHFYFLIALLFPFIVKHIRFAPLVFAACLAMRIFHNINDPSGGFAETHLRLDSLFMGVCVAYAHHHGHLERFHRKYRKYLVAACFIPLLFVFDDPRSDAFTKTIGFALLYISFASLLILYLHEKLPVWDPVARIGVYSYGIYLFHLYIVRFVAGAANESAVPLLLRAPM